MELLIWFVLYTAQKIKFSIKDLFGEWDQVRSFLRIWSHLLKKSLMENFIFCVVYHVIPRSGYNMVHYKCVFRLYLTLYEGKRLLFISAFNMFF